MLPWSFSLTGLVSLKPVKEKLHGNMDSHQSPMNTEFAVEWKGFTANEKRKLKTLWSRLQFPPEFCALFTAEVYKGKPGEDGGIFVHAKSFRIFRQHWMVSLGFAGLEDLVGLARTVVLDASNRSE